MSIKHVTGFILALLCPLTLSCNDGMPIEVENKPSGRTTFAAVEAFGSGASFRASWADVDGDLSPDLAVANDGQNYLYVNDGNGTFTESAAFGQAKDRAAYWVDTDGDTDLDVITLGDDKNCIWVNNDGNFTELAVLGSGGKGISWGDLDGDTDLDFVLSIWPSSTVVLRNQGNNTFELIAQLPKSISSAVADVDGDTVNDILLGAGCCLDSSAVYKNDGSAAFTLLQKFGDKMKETLGFAMADYDGDDDIDMIPIDFDESGEGEVRIHDNKGDGTFTPGKRVTSGSALWVEWIDIEGDGDYDVFTLTLAATGVSLDVHYNVRRSFVTRNIERIPDMGGDLISFFALADVDRDGDLDIATMRATSTGGAAANKLLLQGFQEVE